MKLSTSRKVALASLFTVTAVAFGMSRGHAVPQGTVVSIDTVPTITVMPACTDLGDGEVWIEWNAFLDCDLQPGQTFSYFDVPADSQADCEFYGGTYLADQQVCYAVDF